MMSRESYQVREAMGAEIRPFFFFLFFSLLVLGAHKVCHCSKRGSEN